MINGRHTERRRGHNRSPAAVSSLSSIPALVESLPTLRCQAARRKAESFRLPFNSPLPFQHQLPDLSLSLSAHVFSHGAKNHALHH
jgi:hypothetical protein